MRGKRKGRRERGNKKGRWGGERKGDGGRLKGEKERGRIEERGYGKDEEKR